MLSLLGIMNLKIGGQTTVHTWYDGATSKLYHLSWLLCFHIFIATSTLSMEPVVDQPPPSNDSKL